MIRFNEQYNKFEGLINGRVVSRASTAEKVAATLRAKYGVESTVESAAAHIAPTSIGKKCEFSVAERFEFIEKFTKLVARGVIPSLVITGSGGLGKTHTVIESLKSMGLTEDTIGSKSGDFLKISGYSTARNLYTTLYHNRKGLVIFDDCDFVFKDVIGASILKAALDSGERRVVSWGAESKDDDVPSRFEFLGKVIFISNLSLDKFPQAVVSRSMLADITMSTEEKIERIEHVFMQETRFDKKDKQEVIEFIRRNSTKFKDLNIRSALNTMKMKLAVGENWERMALYSATLN